MISLQFGLPAYDQITIVIIVKIDIPVISIVGDGISELVTLTTEQA